MSRKIAVGVDLGGTNTKIGLVDIQGKIIGSTSFLSKPYSGKSAQLMEAFASTIRGLLKKYDISLACVGGVGCGLPGALDMRKKKVLALTNLEGWGNLPFEKLFKKYLPVPVFMENDANVIGLAEHLYGAGRGVQRMICITLGTGVGGAMIDGGCIYHGRHFSAFEIGHMPLNENGPRCSCGSKGCIETYIGNAAIVRRTRTLLRRKKSLITKLVQQEGGSLSPEVITRAAKQGDALACDIWDEVGTKLGIVLAGVMNLVDPDMIVVTGGVANAGRFLMEPVRRSVAARVMKSIGRHTRIVRGKVRKDVGVIGGAALVWLKAKSKEQRAKS